MSTSFELGSDLRKTSGALAGSRGAISARADAAGGQLMGAASRAIVALKSSSWWAILVVSLAIGCVAYTDHMAEGVSLGYLYILPLSFSAILLSPRLTYAIVVVCILCHDLFGPPIQHLQGRVLHTLDALIGFTFVVTILQCLVAQRKAMNQSPLQQRAGRLTDESLPAEDNRVSLPRRGT